MQSLSLRVLPLALLALAACATTDASLGDGSACESGSECTSGLCVDGRCVAIGVDVVDARGDADVGPADAEDAADTNDVAPLTDVARDAADTDTAPDLADGGDDTDPLRFGQPCDAPGDCPSGFCVSTDDGRVCTAPCVTTCPDSTWTCEQLSTGAGELVSICVPPSDIRCRPCESDLECGALDDLCVQLDDGEFCATNCELEPCPDGFECAPVTRGATQSRQCVPAVGYCGACLDRDGDGYGDGDCLGLDCDDLDSTRSPSLGEQCDRADNDCDSNIDEDFDVLTDVRHCGVCGNACTTVRGTAGCDGGACVIRTCDDGFRDVDGDYVNGCEYACTPTDPADEVCDGADNDCDGRIDDLFDDCVVPNGIPACVDGACAVGACSDGWWDVDGDLANGCEYACTLSEGGVEICDKADNNCDGLIDEDFDLATDPAHCGVCDNACVFDNSTAACVDRICVLTGCVDGTWDIDRDVANGCEYTCAVSNGGVEICDTADNNCDGRADEGFDLSTDARHCGECANACAFEQASAVCVEGSCALDRCFEGFDNCDADPSTGCEAALAASLDHCGACDNACEGLNASWTCLAGRCAVTACDEGFDDCDGLDSNGCEVDLLSSAQNCGTCRNRCSLFNASAACADGFCVVDTCSPGFGDCDLNPFTGCETRIVNNPLHCGACARQCFLPGVGTSCADDRCVIDTCGLGVADCNDVFEDGCEQDVFTDTANCGDCGRVCEAPNAAAYTCAAGNCSVQTCDEGFADCANGYADGCERDIWFNTDACGSCSTPCVTPGANPECVSGVCGWSSCRTHYWDLDLNAANGCEYACVRSSATDAPDMAFADSNCDGLDGEIAAAVFVAPDGRSGGAGTMADPLSTVGAGIARASTTGRTAVYIAQGTYPEAVTLAGGISLYGGYIRRPGIWSRGSLADAPTVVGATTTGMLASGITVATTVQNVRVVSANATLARESSYAVRVIASTSALRFEASELAPGNGAAGVGGDPGERGSSGTAGASGQGGCDGCDSGAYGGAGGASECYAGGTGGRGGHGNSRGGSGFGGAGPAGGSGGGGGAGNGDYCIAGCDSGGTGGAGTDGGNGGGGSSGAAGSPSGTVTSGFWVPANGASGGRGGHGSGGGGGGGGGGSDCCTDDRGGGGGGGGGAGCGGAGGGGGTGGGGSFGLFLVNASPTVVNVSITAGAGGNGGSGRTGGAGGGGGGGGARGGGADDGGPGGPGGSGGSGGTGGCGGGGAGGPSFAVYRAGSSSPTITGGARSAGSPGAGGAGGCTSNGGATGASGGLF